MGIEKGLIFTYVMTYGGFVAGLVNPYIGLLIYIGFAILRPSFLWWWAVPHGPYSRIVAIGFLIGWVISGFGDWKWGKGRAVMLCLIGFLVWNCLSAFDAPNQDWAWGYVDALARVILPCVVGLTLIRTTFQLKLLAWVIVLSHGWVAYELNLAYYDGFNLLEEEGFGGMDNNCVAITMDTATGLAFFLGLSSPRLWQRLLAFLCAALMAHVTMFAFSRGGMLGLALTGLATFFLIQRRPIHYFWFAVALIVGLRLAGTEVTQRFMTVFVNEEARDGSAQSRWVMWGNCLTLMQENPILGVGPHHFPLVAPRFGWPLGKEAHSLWFQVGAELGAPGLLFLVLFYWLCGWRLWRLIRSKDPPPDPWLNDAARMVIASLVGFAVSAQFVSLVGLEAPYYVCLLGAGALKLATVPQAAPVVARPSFAAAAARPVFRAAAWRT